jgi:hypothetical protein
MHKTWLILIFAGIVPMYMHAHVPSLHVINGTEKEIFVRPLGITPPAQGYYNEGAGYLVQGLKHRIPWASDIRTMVIDGKGTPSLKNLDQSIEYQQLLIQARQKNQDLCVTVKSTMPRLIVTNISLCEAQAPFLPVIFIKNNNLLWGNLVNIKLANVPGADKAPIAVSVLAPKQFRLLQPKSLIQDYYLWAQTSSGAQKGFVIAKKTLETAQQRQFDLLIELTIGWSGTISISEKRLNRSQTAELLLRNQKQSGLMQLRTRVARLFGFSGKND